MSYQGFELSSKTTYIFTTDAVSALKNQLKGYHPRKLFIITSDAALPIVSQVTSALGKLELSFVLCADCMSNPTEVFVNSCAAHLVEEQCDFVLGIGGGSVIDAAKATALLAANPQDSKLWDYVTYQKAPVNAAMPLGLIVTIPSTGSESNASAVISNESLGEKLIYTQETMQPAFSITSPALTYTLPAKPAGAGIVDIFSHLMEQYLHNDSNVDVSDNMLLGVMKAVVKWGKTAVEQPDCYDAKANLLFASYLAMSKVLGCGHSENWISHFVEHAISAKFGIAHGAGMAIVMPVYISMITDRDRFGRLQRLKDEVFGEAEGDAAELVKQFFSSLGMPVSLQAAAITLDEDDAKECAQKALPYGTVEIEGYSPFTQESVLELLNLAK